MPTACTCTDLTRLAYGPSVHGPGCPLNASPCRPYAAGLPCKDGRDHCYRCGRHLDGESCPKSCKPNDG